VEVAVQAASTLTVDEGVGEDKKATVWLATGEGERVGGLGVAGEGVRVISHGLGVGEGNRVTRFSANGI
jgi:hypothetical protein